MGIVFRQSFWGAFFGYAGVLVGFVNTIILMPKYMSPDEIGIWRTLLSIATFFMPFVLLGTQNSITRFLPNLSQHERQSIITTLLFWICLTFFGLFIISFLFKDVFVGYYGENAPIIDDHFYYIFILLLCMVVFSYIESISRANLDITTPNFIREVVYKASHLVILILFGIQVIDFVGYLYLQIIIYLILILSLLLLIIFRQKTHFGRLNDFSKTLKKQIFRYGLFAILNGLGVSLLLQVDKIMVAKYLGFEEVAIYTIATYFGLVIGMPSKYIAQITTPILTKHVKKEEMDKVEELYQSSAINQFIVTTFIFLLIFINVSDLYTLVPNGEIYAAGISIVFVTGISKIIEGGFGVGGVVIMVSDHFKIHTLFIAVTGIINFILNFYTIPKFGLIGAAVSTALSYLAFNIIRYVFLKKKFELEPFNLKYFIFLVFSALCFYTCFKFRINFENVFLSIIVNSILASVIFFVGVLVLKPSKSIQLILNSLIKKVL